MKPAYDGWRGRVQRLGIGMLLATGLMIAATSAQARVATPPTASHTVLVFGDSLSAGYGLQVSQGWASLLGNRLRTTNPGWRVVNASVSGETTAGGLSRLPAELRRVRPSVVVIELGANDGLRGLPTSRMQANLDAMVRMSRASGARVLLLGMQMPPNLGRAYAQGFSNAYATVARTDGAALLPFFLQPIILDRNAFQPDNLHPTAAVQGRLLDHVWTYLRPLLR